MASLARGQITVSSELDRVTGLRNLVRDGSREHRLEATAKDDYRYDRWTSGSVDIVSSKTYTLGAYVEVLKGQPDNIGALLYKTRVRSQWTHLEGQAIYDYAKGGKQWLTWTFPAAKWPDGERRADFALIYAGRIGRTSNNHVTISNVILIEGDIAPSQWVPAPEDLEESAKSAARVQAYLRHRDLVSIERDRLYEVYRKLRTDRRTPKDIGLRLEQLWISCNGAYSDLYQSCNNAINSPTDANASTADRLTGVYKSKVIDLQRGIQEVEQAIREDVLSEARGVSYAKLDATALDPNKWYPITIELTISSTQAGEEKHYELKLTRSLFHVYGAKKQEWWRHTHGYHFSLRWSVQPSGWGQRREDRRVYAYYTSFLQDGVPVVSMPKQITEGSVEYVYVRGGSSYELSVVGRLGLPIQIHPNGFEWRSSPGDDTYLRRLPVLDNIDAIGTPKIDLDTLSDKLLAEIAKERGLLQQAIERAKTASAQDYETRVQGVLGQLSQLEGLVRDGQASLQRQIDKQVERHYGSEIARSGVPPTNLWPASDNAKHEGDTYTCVAPNGVTITASNAHEYPNVGRSWRWTNGGSGAAYGWEVIADTDITQALALASKAQATADGKMTHYITPTPPVTYQQGDQWTLPAPWQGRKDGRAYTYPAGSILTATADSISGQHHPEHWVELVRYTDLKLDDIKVGGRNLLLASGAPKTSNVYHLGTWRLGEDWQADAEYTISIWMRHNSTSSQEIYIYPNDGFSSLAKVEAKPGDLQQVVLTYILPSRVIKPTASRELRLYAMSNHPGRGGSVEYVIERIAVVRGNVPPSSWTPAPEDVQAEIEAKARELQSQLDAAKRDIQSASSAASSARSEAESAKRAALANDGKIDQAESRSIAKAIESYRKSLLTEWDSLIAAYSQLRSSSYLSDKAALNSAKSAAESKYALLINTLASILSDSSISASEMAKYEGDYTAYRDAAKVLQQAIESAQKAVQAELLRLASADAQAKVDEVDERVTEIKAELRDSKYLTQATKAHTSITGGFILTSLMGVRDSNGNGRVVAYVNGSSSNPVAYAAGVSDFGTSSESRYVEIHHSGYSRFGDIVIDPATRSISYYRDGRTGYKPYLVTGGDASATLAHLIDGQGNELSLLDDMRWEGDGDYIIEGERRTVYYETKPFSHLGEVIVSMPISMWQEAISGRAGGALSITLDLLKVGDPSYERRVDSQLWERNSTGRETRDITLSRNMGYIDGECYLRLKVSYSSRAGRNRAGLKINEIKYGDKIIGRHASMHLSETGLYALYSKRSWLAIRDSGEILACRGRTNIPGVLLAGRVEMIGGRPKVVALWGAMAHRGSTVSVHLFGGMFEVDHRIGHKEYSVHITPQRGNGSNDIIATYGEVNTTYFNVHLRSGGQDWIRSGFSFTCIGHNDN